MIPEEVKKATDRIREIIPAERIIRDEPMSAHTSFRIGGPAALFVTAENEEELSAVLSVLAETGAEQLLIGNGSNLLVADEGYPGVIVKLAGGFESISQSEEDPCLVRVGAARLMSSTSAFLTGRGLAGFEFASGIPGSIGGAVFMDAGAYGGEMKDVVESVRVMLCHPEFPSCHPERSEGSFAIRTFSNEEMDFSYRHSAAQDKGMIVLSAVLRLTQDDPEAIAARVAELAAKRNAKQPVAFPSAGSTFKRPAGGYAAALIEASGLKGYRVGGAEVSEKHAGFVINTGGATADDVLAVMRHVREKVYADSGIMLEPEVRLINCSLRI